MILYNPIMQLKSVLVVAMAALLCVPAMAQKKAKKAAKGKKAVAAATLTPALKSVDGKTFSYALGVAQGQSLKQYLVQREGVDSAYVKDAMEGMNANLSDSERKQKVAYAAGLRIGEMNQRNLVMFNKQAVGKQDSAYVDLATFQQALAAAALGQSTTITADSAMKVVEQQFQYQQTVYKNLNTQWLENN